MSNLWRRALRVAQSNLNDLKDRATSIGRTRPLGEMSDAELEAELERRRRDHTSRAVVDEARKKTDEVKKVDGSGRSSFTGDIPIELMDLSPQKRRKVRQYYVNLELPFGASLDEVKQAYRRLMRQYHPDKHQDDPARRQLATQLSQKLTKAYNELNQLLRKKKM